MKLNMWILISSLWGSSSDGITGIRFIQYFLGDGASTWWEERGFPAEEKRGCNRDKSYGEHERSLSTGDNTINMKKGDMHIPNLLGKIIL